MANEKRTVVLTPDYVNHAASGRIASSLRSRVPMLKRIVTVGILFLLVTLDSFRSKDKSDPDPIMAEVTTRGRALFQYDEAAWHASDALQATHPATTLLGRYIAHKSDSRWVVGFGHLSEQRDKSCWHTKLRKV